MKDVLTATMGFIVITVLVFCLVLARANGELRERLKLHEVLLTGPSACTVTRSAQGPRMGEEIYFLVCRREEAE